jgi:hypothetical protein
VCLIISGIQINPGFRGKLEDLTLLNLLFVMEVGRDDDLSDIVSTIL